MPNSEAQRDPSAFLAEAEPVTRELGAAGRSLRVTIEAGLWRGLERIAALEGVPLDELVMRVVERLPAGNSLAAGLRVFVAAYRR
jgi:predicted DNA-binding ribbon-helix-helix protein